jgi:hypothetical protein
MTKKPKSALGKKWNVASQMCDYNGLDMETKREAR